MSITLYNLLNDSFQYQPNRPAIFAPGRNPLNNSELIHLMDSTRSRLNALGIGRGDTLAMALPNGPEMATAFLAVTTSAISAPLNPAYRLAEFDYYLTDLQAKALLVLAGDPTPAASAAHERGIPVFELIPNAGGPAGLFSIQGSPIGSTLHRGLPEPGDTALVLHTSGTTARPKIVPLSQANLASSAANIAASLQLSARDRCLNVMPLFHVHGLLAALLASLAAGGSVVCTPGFSAADFFTWLDELQPTWYTAVPSMHQSILTRSASRQARRTIHSLRFIRSCSSALPPQVMVELEAQFGVPVLEAYGMTEASHQIAVNPLPPHPRKPGSVGLPSGSEVTILDIQSENHVPSGTTGEIALRGPGLMPGYLNNNEANVKAFTAGWFRTGDQGYLDPDGYIFITGRIKEMINRGGEKISPREVDEVLLAHPGVAQAVTFGMPDPELGEEVAAAVVVRDTNITEHELRQFTAQRLMDAKVPRRILILTEIPKGPTGKIQRIGLAQKLGLDGAQPARSQPSEQQPEFTPPRTETEQFVAELWRDLLRLDQVSVFQPYGELGGDSLFLARLANRIRYSLSLEVGLLELLDAPTLAAQAALVEAKLAATPD